MRNLILFLGFGVIMSMVMTKALLEYRRRQQRSQQYRLQLAHKPRKNMGYLSQPIAHG